MMKRKSVFFILVVFVLVVCYQIYLNSYINSLKRQLNIEKVKVTELTNELSHLKNQDSDISSFQEKKIYIDKQVAACMQKEHYTTAGMSKCVNNSIDAWKNEINANLQRFSSSFTPEQSSLLLDTQEKWEAYRKSQYLLLNETVGTLQGTIYINILSAEKASLFEERASDLDALQIYLESAG